jgi:CheY-like chemotaxis protein
VQLVVAAEPAQRQPVALQRRLQPDAVERRLQQRAVELDERRRPRLAAGEADRDRRAEGARVAGEVERHVVRRHLEQGGAGLRLGAGEVLHPGTVTAVSCRRLFERTRGRRLLSATATVAATSREEVRVAALTVLYVEDNASNRRLVERLLARRPEVTLHLAATGREGLELAGRERLDAVLLDLDLPDVTGEQVLAELGRRPDSPPVVVLSSEAMPETRGRVLALGARAYLTKPLDVAEFYATLDRVTASGPGQPAG